MSDIVRAAGGTSSSHMLLQQKENLLGVSRNVAIKSSNTMTSKPDLGASTNF